MKTTKLKIKKKARLSRGYITLLKDDLEQICIDANDNDFVNLEESIQYAKDTIQKLFDNITEIEYMMYLLKHK